LNGLFCLSIKRAKFISDNFGDIKEKSGKKIEIRRKVRNNKVFWLSNRWFWEFYRFLTGYNIFINPSKILLFWGGKRILKYKETKR
jgi:hypothetical protein